MIVWTSLNARTEIVILVREFSGYWGGITCSLLGMNWDSKAKPSFFLFWTTKQTMLGLLNFETPPDYLNLSLRLGPRQFGAFYGGLS